VNPGVIHHQFGYNRWATGLIINAAGNLSQAQLVATDDTPFKSIRNELVHLLDSQQTWVEIVRASLSGGARESTSIDPEDVPDLEALVRLWHEVESITDACLATLNADELQKTIIARFDWAEISAPAWLILMHTVNHGTQHRSEVAMKLTNFGYSPGMLDFLFYWMEISTG
jgi:uncharacterized damage-inducible protein DinB